MSYAFVHEGKAYGPSGRIEDVEGTPLEAKDAATYNKALEANEIEWLKTAPDKVMLYVKVGMLRDPNKLGSRLTDGSMARANGDEVSIQTWLGTKVSTHEWLGPKRHIGFGFSTYRRAVSCRIFGVLYHGWFYQSSGDYCRLRKAKVQK